MHCRNEKSVRARPDRTFSSKIGLRKLFKKTQQETNAAQDFGSSLESNSVFPSEELVRASLRFRFLKTALPEFSLIDRIVFTSMVIG